MVPPLVSATNAYRSKAGTDMYYYCGNCTIVHPQMKLARILEMAWSRMCQSRFALPFFVPFLKPGELTGDEEVSSLDGEPNVATEADDKFLEYFPKQNNSFMNIH